MRRGRTVEIKTSSATAWTGSMTTLRFVSQPANCSTLLWPQLQRSCPRSSWNGQSVSSCQQDAVALLERRWQADNHRQGLPGQDRTRAGGRASLYLEHHTLLDRQPCAADEALVQYGRISYRPLPTWRQRAVRTAGDRTVRSWCQSITIVQVTGNESLE